jgi:RNA polymerase sigma factor (sigma-70 family)
MHEPSEADRYLLEEIRRGSGEAWSQLIDRYEGRLIAYARRQAPKGNDPEDLVQDTFLLFLKGLRDYRQEASLETFLFLILRRRLADAYRVGRIRTCSSAAKDDSSDIMQGVAAPDPTASQYVRRAEDREMARVALGAALHSLVRSMQESQEFQDLQIAELLFYAQWKNQRISQALGIDAAQIGSRKHRWIKAIAERVAQAAAKQMGRGSGPIDNPDLLDSLLTEVWQDQRPSCPKRSTIGGFVLGTLDDPWQRYIDFHVHRMECSFCRANLEDLQAQSRQDQTRLRQRIMESTVGFFRKG